MYNPFMPLRVPVPAQPAQEFITGFMAIMSAGAAILGDVEIAQRLMLLVAAGTHYYVYRKISRRELNLWRWSPISLAWLIIFVYSLAMMIAVF